MVCSFIVYNFQKNKDYYVEVDEIQAIENAYYNQLDSDGSTPPVLNPDRTDNMSMPA